MEKPSRVSGHVSHSEHVPSSWCAFMWMVVTLGHVKTLIHYTAECPLCCVYQECCVLTGCPQRRFFSLLLTTLKLNTSFIRHQSLQYMRITSIQKKKIRVIYLKTSSMYIMASIVLLKKISELHSTFQALIQKPQV